MEWKPDPEFAALLDTIVIRAAMQLRDRLSRTTSGLKADHVRQGIVGSGAAAHHIWSVWRGDLETLPGIVEREALALLKEHGATLDASKAAWLADALDQHMDDLVVGLTRESAALLPPLGFTAQLKECFGRFKARVRSDLGIEARRSALSGAARLDEVVPLLRKSALDEDLPKAVRDAAASGHRLAVLFLDLDGFKALNDSHGHQAGDEALRAFAERLKNALGPRGTAYRDGGDEFVVLVPACAEAEASALVDSLRIATTSKPFTPHNVRLGVSIGLAISEDDQTAENLLKEADAAMYQDKAARHPSAKPRVLTVFSTTNYEPGQHAIGIYLEALGAGLDARGAHHEEVPIDSLSDAVFKEKLAVTDLVLFLLSPRYVGVWGERLETLAALLKEAAHRTGISLISISVAVDGLRRKDIPRCLAERDVVSSHATDLLPRLEEPLAAVEIKKRQTGTNRHTVV